MWLLKRSKMARPDAVSYATAIDACVLSGQNLDQAWKLVEQAERKPQLNHTRDFWDAK